MYRDLELSDRARIIQMAVRSGITDLDTIEEVYNRFADGGPKERLINRINTTSKANFVQRLKDPNRQFIKNPDGTISTHSMSYATADDGAIVYPEVQEIDGVLQRVNPEGALDSAIARGDTLMMSAPEAAWFTANYKKYYPKGNTFGDGGSKSPYNGEIKQGKKWTPLDHYLADNPKVAHGFRKAGVLVSDLARLIPGITTRGVEINPQKLSDYGDAVDIANQENDQDSFVDRMNEGGTYLGAIGRTVKPIVTRLKKDFPKWEWTPRITGMTDSFINTDRLINMGQFIDDFATPVEQFRDGGKIHIKPENRGKFTALKKRTGKSASWFKAHGTPAQKKMATFALNARKWKHSDGGLMTKF